MNPNPMTTQSQPPAASEAAHTPTPYTGDTSRANHCGLVGFAINHCFPGPINIQCHRVAVCEKEEDRAFIVRACNSHAALVEALEDAQKVMADAADYLAKRNLGEPARLLFGRLYSQQAKARAALAKS